MTVWGDILTHAQDALEALGLTGDPDVHIRKANFILKDDEFPMINLFPLPEQETGEDFTELTVGMIYPLGVGIVLSPGVLLGSTEETSMLEYRQAIRRCLRSVRVVAPSECSVMNVKVTTNPEFDPVGRRDNIDVSTMIFTYEIQEPRIT